MHLLLAQSRSAPPEVFSSSGEMSMRKAAFKKHRVCERFLIMGVGNELLSDDGVGVHAVRKLQGELIEGASAIEVGTAVLHGLDFLHGIERVLVIDAATGGQPPGTIYLYDAKETNDSQAVTSIHAMGLREAANLLLGDQLRPSFTVLGVEPRTIEYGLQLSAPVEAALPKVIELARETVRQWFSANTNLI